VNTCLTCANWEGKGVPMWAFKLGMACCSIKNTKAVTLNHWAACGRWRRANTDQVDERVVWLKRVGVEVKNQPSRKDEHEYQ
jgi:NADH:ubiquinone oxidoreductase subunit B-like Fe-S oxidoreductase